MKARHVLSICFNLGRAQHPHTNAGTQPSNELLDPSSGDVHRGSGRVVRMLAPSLDQFPFANPQSGVPK